MQRDTELVAVLVTAPDAETGETLATAVVQERLAACVNIVPGLTSVYRWEGRVHRDAEVLLVMKTTAAGAGALRERVLELHPYEVPEVLVLPVAGGHGAYMEWVRSAVGGPA